MRERSKKKALDKVDEKRERKERKTKKERETEREKGGRE